MFFETETEWLLYNLWSRSQPSPTKFNFKIPDTIVCRDGRLQSWYFTNKDGFILKKNRSNVTLKKAFNCLNTNLPCKIQAYHYTLPQEAPYHNRPIDLFLNYVQQAGPYLSQMSGDDETKSPSDMIKERQDNFNPFAPEVDPKKPQIIQKFIEPRQLKNHLIRCNYSYFTDTMEVAKVTNNQNFYAQQFSMELRCATFECENSDLVKQEIDLAPELKNELQKSCQQIVYHIGKNCAVQVQSANFYFKQDVNNQIYLICASCIKVDRPFQCLNGDRLVSIGLLAYSEFAQYYQQKHSEQIEIHESKDSALSKIEQQEYAPSKIEQVEYAQSKIDQQEYVSAAEILAVPSGSAKLDGNTLSGGDEDIPIDESEDDSSENQKPKGGFTLVGHVSEGKDLARPITASGAVNQKPPLQKQQSNNQPSPANVAAPNTTGARQSKPRINSACPKNNQKRVPQGTQFDMHGKLIPVEESQSYKFVRQRYAPIDAQDTISGIYSQKPPAQSKYNKLQQRNQRAMIYPQLRTSNTSEAKGLGQNISQKGLRSEALGYHQQERPSSSYNQHTYQSLNKQQYVMTQQAKKAEDQNAAAHMFDQVMMQQTPGSSSTFPKYDVAKIYLNTIKSQEIQRHFKGHIRPDALRGLRSSHQGLSRLAQVKTQGAQPRQFRRQLSSAQARSNQGMEPESGILGTLGNMENMSMGQVHQIAKNADQLIDIIKNIKKVADQDQQEQENDPVSNLEQEYQDDHQEEKTTGKEINEDIKSATEIVNQSPEDQWWD